jgi:hypothetical protein
MEVEREIHALAAETLALQSVLTQALYRLSKLGPDVRQAIVEAFDDAANITEHTAIQVGKAASPEHTVKALRVVEELRAVVFGDQGKPKHRSR